MPVMEAPSEEKIEISNGESLSHARCGVCYPDRFADNIITLCGVKYIHRGKGGTKKPKCVVCVDLFNRACPTCGTK